MRYEFIEHFEKVGWYVVTDTKWMMVCEFKAHEYNETQNFIDVGQLNGKDAQTVAQAMSELGDWLFIHHYSEVFPVPQFEVRLSDDDSELHIIKHSDPRMDSVFDTSDLSAVSSALSEASDFVRIYKERHTRK